jgi:hypothetical protein
MTIPSLRSVLPRFAARHDKAGRRSVPHGRPKSQVPVALSDSIRGGCHFATTGKLALTLDKRLDRVTGNVKTCLFAGHLAYPLLDRVP